MRWFTSDTHFWHKQIIGYDDRPYSSIEEMEECLITNWNMCVSKKDIVYHLGDFAFGNPKRWKSITDRLHGQITLVRGNHDLQNGATLRRLVVDGSPIFNDVCDVDFTRIGNIKVMMSHYPYQSKDERMKEYYPNNTGLWLLHGHTHKTGHGSSNIGKVDTDMKTINVGCMLWNYMPVSEIKILEIIKEDEYGI